MVIMTYLQTCQPLIQENLETNEKKKKNIYIYIYWNSTKGSEILFFFIGSKLNKSFFPLGVLIVYSNTTLLYLWSLL